MFTWLGILFAPDTGAGDGSDGAADNSPVEDAPQQGADSAGTSKNAEDGKRHEDNVQMAREAFNERIRKAKASGQRDLLKTLGFEDVGDPTKLSEAQAELVELVTWAREQRKAQMSAEERFQEEIARYKKAAEEATQRLRELQMKERKRTVQDAIINAAKGEGAQSPEDVYAWAVAFADGDVQSLLEGDGEGWELDEDGVKALIEKCKAERPDKFKPQHPGIPSNQGARPPMAGAKMDQKARDGLRNYAQRSF